MLAAESNAVDRSNPRLAKADSAPNWKQIVEPARPFLQQVVQRLGEQVQTFEPEIAEYARYALTNQGKQLRPALVALSAGAVGKLNDSHITAAVIIEMVHLATLVHDDIMDEAEIRRCRPTLAANWGNEISVLLGDCLFAHALKLAAGFPTTEVCRAVASATKTVCSGEILQTNRRRNFELTRAEYFKMLEMKTAELFALSCELGASLTGANPAEKAALRQYGMTLGTAYQVYDDCVDLFGLETTVGKSLGTDLASGKMTLPMLVLWERATPVERTEFQNLLQDWQPIHFPRVLELLKKYETLEAARATLQEYLTAARQSVAGLPKNSNQLALNGLADFLSYQCDDLGLSN